MEQSSNLFELQVDQNSSAFLRETAKWSKFLSIVGFVMMGIVLLAVIFAGTTMATVFSSAYGSAGGALGVAYVAVLAGVMLIYFFPCLYLYKFSTKMQVALRNNDQETLNSSFENLKSCFKFMGIFMLIVLSIYALAFVIGIAAAAMM